MDVGRKLWALVLIKVVVLVTLALTLFPDLLSEQYDTDDQRAEHVLDALAPVETAP